ncbi:inositol monophosphatase family protein [Streptomyces sp. NPDC007100]|uniref:inositol monophosphatase family protein n=1 Tax=unclassified Streptomyces TaxID=2593676 RepID=UPI0033D83FC0
METDSDVVLAHHLVDVADRISLEFFGRRPPTRTKADGSPVSEADLAVERALLAVLAAERPADAVLTEESGAIADARRRWILDPIDGTIPFLRGERAWGTHVALEIDGELRLAVLSRPTEGARWWARHGHGAFAATTGQPLSTERRLRLSRAAALRQARVGGFLFPGSPADALQEHVRWVESDVCLIGDLLEGRVDAVIDEGGHVWDRAPAALLVREAGGHVDDLHGSHRLDRPWLVYASHGIARELTELVRGVAR